MRSKIIRRRPLAAISAVSIGAGMLSGLSLLTASPAPAQSAGTVKINGLDITTANEPHVDCPFTVTFNNFSTNLPDTGTVTAAVIPPTSNLPDYTGTSFPPEQTSWSTAASPDGKITPSIADLNTLLAGLSNIDLPFHVSLTTTVTDNTTNVVFSKTKSFWVQTACPDVALSKTADNSSVAAGGSIGYTIQTVVTNATARGVVVSDQLPTNATGWAIVAAGTTFPAGRCSISAGTLTCGAKTGPNALNLVPGTYSVHITATAPSAAAANCGAVTNIATADAAYGTITGSPTGAQTITVTGCGGPPTPSVTLSKSDYPNSDPVAAGSSASFDIQAVVTNASASKAQFTVSDNLPTNTASWSIGTLGAGMTALPNCSVAAGPPQVLTCDESGTGLGNGTYDVVVTATTNSSSCAAGVANTVTGSAVGSTSLSGSGSGDTVTVNSCSTTVTVAKSPDATPVTAGNNVGFTIEVDVTGLDPANNVDVSDTLPTTTGSWTIASQSANWPTPCNISAGVLDCSEASLPASTTTTSYTVDVTAPSTAASCPTVSNTASTTVGHVPAVGSPASASVTVTGCSFGGGPPPPPPPSPTTGGSGGASFLGVNRIGGTDRIDTADLISQATYAAGGAGAVVLARSDLFPDSLAGTPLAVLHHAPILLTPPKYLDPRTAAEIQRVLSHGGTAYLLGQTDALSTTVLNSVKALGYNAVRIGGIDRFATAADIGNSLGTLNRIFLADGANFPDALTAAAASGTGGTAIILTNGLTMPAVSTAFVAAHPGSTKYDVGGPAAGAAPAGATLLVGADRYATSVLVAQTFFSNPTGAGVATGVNFPDALTAGPYLVTLNWPMLLTDPANLPASVSTYLTSVKPSMVALTVFGGVAAVSANVFNQLVALFS